MAAQKKIDDVKSPSKVTPPSSGRPIIVTDRPVLASDPMIADKPAEEEKGASVPVVRTAKTIKPLNDDIKPADTAKEKTEPEAEPAETDSKPAEAETTNKPVEAAADEPGTGTATEPEAEKEPEPAEEKPAEGEPVERDNEAAAAAAEAEAEAARQAREAELDQLAASGKYAVPINAVERKRTTRTSIMLVIVMVLLSVALIDLMLDANMIELVQKLPHTHFFSAK